MEFLRHFFRAKEDYIDITPFNLIHIEFLIVLALLIYYTLNLRNKDQITKNRFIKSIGVGMIITLGMIYFWYFAFRTFSFEESLPFFHCRIVTYLFIYHIFVGNEKLMKVSIHWGLMGGILSNLLPDPMKYRFPHLTNFEFFAIHFLMLLAALYYIFIEKVKMDKKDLKFVVKFTIAIDIFIALFNIVFNSMGYDMNYSYLYHAPDVIARFVPFDGIIYMIVAQIAYILLTFVLHGIYQFLSNVSDRMDYRENITEEEFI